ncbi:MAG: dissimilatory sulfite reductase D family protein [Desulfarculus sp.]|nr:dissimilatory sulfite reductase D family protein [Pseudomonadota bacterium]MBV1715514.1 dissimilatory sulfite reductase D family protein [Desulfarculus sp.]MCG2766293.1 dissimilatory sulfite reductase D family protein [Desulfarculaceae bacterium]MBU4384559.1 dissimilatory sulfite reductase D family protein [Pseudomonadota bacterium]MBU4566254.1 dissimilatory sulfite reductase D family protein [Pseudomonadota bacterium]
MATEQEIRDLVIQVMEKKQKRMMMKDLLKEVQKLDESVEKRSLKKATTTMIQDQSLQYWSSGSTTYFALPGGKHAEGED